MTWLLDACVLVRAQDADRLAELVKASGDMAVVREVYEEVTQPRGAKPETQRKAAAAKAEIDRGGLQVMDIPVLSAAGARFGAMRQGREGPNDAGEAASVALTAFDRNLVFVTVEKGAAWLAMKEVDRQCVVLHGFLRALVEEGSLTRESAHAIAAADRQPPPSWWAAWCR